MLILPNNRIAVDIYCSQFCLVIRANDDTLWAMGLGEHDNLSYVDPIQVENDYRINDASSTPSNFFPRSEFKIKKGYKRVSLHSNAERVNSVMEAEEAEPTVTSKFGSALWDSDLRRKYSKSFEVVLNCGEAYIIGLDMNDVDNIAGSVIDYSSAWQHEVVLVN
jgi:hypothetical protein